MFDFNESRKGRPGVLAMIALTPKEVLGETDFMKAFRKVLDDCERMPSPTTPEPTDCTVPLVKTSPITVTLHGSRAARKELQALLNVRTLVLHGMNEARVRRGWMWLKRARRWSNKCHGEASPIKFMVRQVRCQLNLV